MSHLKARAYGMIFAVTHRDSDTLYSAPNLQAYRPEAIWIETLDAIIVPALCYNLIEPPQPHERNPDYATRLQRVLTKLKFPSDYVRDVAK